MSPDPTFVDMAFSIALVLIVLVCAADIVNAIRKGN